MSPISESQKDLIAREVVRVLKGRFDKFPDDASENRNAPFHEAFLNAFSSRLTKSVSDVPYFISLSSWLHGLNTTLGQAFFENTAHILSSGTKKKIEAPKIGRNQQRIIAEILTDLKNSARKPDPDNESILIDVPIDDEVDGPEFTADNFIDDGIVIEGIELKTVKPNASINRDEKQKILVAKAFFRRIYPNRKVSFLIGFPFDPLSENPTTSDKVRFMNSIVEFNKFFHPDEVLLADELWDHLSGGQNTMQQILDIINAIATPSFLEDYEFLCDPKNNAIDGNRYRSILHKWNLFGEMKLVDNFEKIQAIANSDKRVARVLLQPLFNSKDEYNDRRLDVLSRL